jgi:methyl-accepting chemotaxis protein
MPNAAQPHPEHDTLRRVMDGCAQRLPELLPRLSKVIKDREEDFLRLGSDVFVINSQTGAFSTSASRMASAVGEEALHAAISELHAQAAEAKSVFASGSSDEQLQGMSQVLQLIHSLNEAMGQFHTLVQTLKVLEITTRIESARLGSTGGGFTTLADDVKSLGTIIADQSNKIAEYSALLMTQVATAREHGKRQLSSQKQVVEEMFARLFSGINELETMRTGSAALVQELAKGSRNVAESMGHVVAAVQFHDITRQQVEHVEEILVQAVHEIDQLATGMDEVGLGAWVRDVLKLQAPQLQQTQAMFSQAVVELIDNLNAIGGRIHDLQDKITAVAYEGRGKTSILDRIRQHIAQVIGALRATSTQVAEMSKTMADMADTISTVSTFVRGIEDIGAEIEIIALNARVKAAHTGEQGRTLGVIAMEIQYLSVAARERTGKVAGILSQISSLADHLADLARTSNVVELVGTIQGRFEAVLGQLSGLDEELGKNIDHLYGLGKGLVTQIDALTSSIHFHELVSSQLSDIKMAIEDLGSRFEPHAHVLNTARQPEKLREQLSRYTMDSERLIHLAVLSEHGPAGADTGADLFADTDVELFGDDCVELFGDTEDDLDAAPHSPDSADKSAAEDDLGDNVELF